MGREDSLLLSQHSMFDAAVRFLFSLRVTCFVLFMGHADALLLSQHSMFDAVVLSCTVHCTWPEPLKVLIFCRRLGVTAQSRAVALHCLILTVSVTRKRAAVCMSRR